VILIEYSNKNSGRTAYVLACVSEVKNRDKMEYRQTGIPTK